MLPVRTLFTLNTILVSLLALGSIFAPSFVLEINGYEVNDFTVSLQQVVGAAMVGYAVASWLMRDTEASLARRAFLIGGGVGYFVIAAVISFNKLFTGLGSDSLWVYVAVSVLLGLDFVVYGYKEPIGK